MERDPGTKNDYRRAQIDRKPSSQPPPTLGKARNNSVQWGCVEEVPSSSSAAMLRLAVMLIVNHCLLSMSSESVSCLETENTNMRWEWVSHVGLFGRTLLMRFFDSSSVHQTWRTLCAEGEVPQLNMRIVTSTCGAVTVHAYRTGQTTTREAFQRQTSPLDLLHSLVIS